MASSDPEIKNGFSPPVWMKNKQSKDFEAFAGSPPAPEDSFFYIRYPKTDVVFGRSKTQQELPNVLTEPPKDVKAATAFNSTKEKDWSKHTKPCQDVLHGIAPINTAASGAAAKPKPAGVDDGFKGEGAACGSSIVKVAHQMISSNPRGGGGGGGGGRGFTVASPAEDAEAAAEAAQYLRARRGSRSLPVTPTSSPTSRRKMNGNRYFTSPFEPTEALGARGWLAAALLGGRAPAGSSAALAEEDGPDARLGVGTLAQSVESLGPSPRDKHPKVLSSPAPAQPAQAFRPKPSELREMNFWSPTSM